MRKFLLVSVAAVGAYAVVLFAAGHLQGYATWHEVPDSVA